LRDKLDQIDVATTAAVTFEALAKPLYLLRTIGSKLKITPRSLLGSFFEPSLELGWNYCYDVVSDSDVNEATPVTAFRDAVNKRQRLCGKHHIDLPMLTTV
jgi:hypothetical protein